MVVPVVSDSVELYVASWMAICGSVLLSHCSPRGHTVETTDAGFSGLPTALRRSVHAACLLGGSALLACLTTWTVHVVSLSLCHSDLIWACQVVRFSAGA